jgi:hypothetical protein
MDTKNAFAVIAARGAADKNAHAKKRAWRGLCCCQDCLSRDGRDVRTRGNYISLGTAAKHWDVRTVQMLGQDPPRFILAEDVVRMLVDAGAPPEHDLFPEDGGPAEEEAAGPGVGSPELMQQAAAPQLMAPHQQAAPVPPMQQAAERCACTRPCPQVGPEKGGTREYIGHYACLPAGSLYESAGTLPGEDGSQLCTPAASTSMDEGSEDPELLHRVRQDLIGLLKTRSDHPGTPIALMDNILLWYQRTSGLSSEYVRILQKFAPTYNKAMSFISEESGQVRSHPLA